MDRRQFVWLAGVAAAGAVLPARSGAKNMYGLIGKIVAVPGKRGELVSTLLDGIGSMPGCLSYVVAKDPENPDSLWITEVWDSAESHRASLALPAVRAAIERGKPLIASFVEHHVTEPVGGHGLPS